MRFELGKLELFGLDLSGLWQRWWMGINSLLPVPLASIFLRPAPRIQAVFNQDGIVFRGGAERLAEFGLAELDLLEDGRLHERLVAGYKLKELQLDMLLPEQQVLRRHVSVPLAARSSLRQVLAFQVGRLTPFRLDQVMYDVVVREARPAAGLLDVELLVAPKEFVQKWLAEVERVSGLKVARVQVADAGPEVNVLGRLGIPSGWWRRLNLNSFLSLVLCVCLAAVLVAPVVKLRMEVLRGKQEIAALDARLSGVRSDWHRLQNVAGNLSFVLGEQAHYGRTTQLLQELTRIIPDSIYLTNMTVNRDKIDITGNGRNVVELIDVLNTSSLFQQARFSSAVTHGRDGAEAFSVTMLLAPPGETP